MPEGSGIRSIMEKWRQLLLNPPFSMETATNRDAPPLSLRGLISPQVFLRCRVLRRLANSIEAHSGPMEKRGGKGTQEYKAPHYGRTMLPIYNGFALFYCHWCVRTFEHVALHIGLIRFLHFVPRGSSRFMQEFRGLKRNSKILPCFDPYRRPSSVV